MNNRFNDFNKRQDAFDRHFRIMQRVVIGIFILTAIVMVGIFSFQGYVAYKVASDPNAFAQDAGEVFKSFLDGADIGE